MRKIETSLTVCTLAAYLFAGGAGLAPGAEPLGSGFSFQGQLKQGGAPLNNTADFEFTLWDADVNGNMIGALVPVDNVAVVDGLFTVGVDFGLEAFNGQARFLEVAVRSPHDPGDTEPFTTLDPRQELTATPYALALPALRTEQRGGGPNVIGGHPGNSVAGAFSGATIAGGGVDDPVDDLVNLITGNLGSIGGGGGNTAFFFSTVGGGTRNTASEFHSTVGGGRSNTASGDQSTVPGGGGNTAAGDYSFAAGRRAKANHSGAFVWADSANADFASSAADQFLIRAAGGVGIGETNPSAMLDVVGTTELNGDVTINGTITSPGDLELHVGSERVMRLEAGGFFGPHVIGGHSSNSVNPGLSGATIAGGGGAAAPNLITGNYGSIGGGFGNTASGSNATIGGGIQNNVGAGANGATIGGGLRNTASALRATVGGGNQNSAGGHGATVGGGGQNSSNGDHATVGGGYSNTANGSRATVPGGEFNKANGRGSFAAGQRASAEHDSAFVWNDDLNQEFSSTGPNQFLIHASGGVGIGETNPSAALDVLGTTELNGDVTITSTSKLTVNTETLLNGNLAVNTNTLFVNAAKGRVGIGTTDPSTTLDVVGNTEFNGDVDIEGNIRLNNNDMYLRAGEDVNYGLGRYGFGRPFAGDDSDGAILYGFSGGSLGSNHNGNQRRALTWRNNGNVGIGTTKPERTLHVVGSGIIMERNSNDPAFMARNTTNGEVNAAFGVRFTDLDDGWAFVTDQHQFKTLYIRDRKVGIGTTNPQAELHVNGWTRTRVLEITGGSDIAEPYDIAPYGQSEPIPGMVVSIDPNQLGKMRVSGVAYDRKVAGIISGANGVTPGLTLTQEGTVADGALPVASVGRVWCWCDADAGGPIRAGDLLTSSGTPGHAMKVTQRDRSQGAIIGKAMSSLSTGRGLVLVLVSLQ